MDESVSGDTKLLNGERGPTSKFLLIFVFVASFLFFLYLTFPYNVLKEYVVNQINRSSGVALSVGELQPSLPIGLTGRDVVLAIPSGGGQMRLKEVDLSLSLLSLITGKLGMNVTLLAKDSQELEVFSSLSLAGIFSGNFIPSTIELQSTNFPIDGLSDFGMALAAKNAGQGGLIGDFVKKLRLGGELNGKVDLDIEPQDLAQSFGQLKVSLRNGFFYLDDAALDISQQNFKKAIITANLENSKLNIDRSSGFVSQELDFLFSGFIKFGQALPDSTISLEVELALKDSLKNAIGFLVDSLTGGQDGKSNFKLSGSLLAPQREKLQR